MLGFAFGHVLGSALRAFARDGAGASRLRDFHKEIGGDTTFWKEDNYAKCFIDRRRIKASI